MYFNVNRDSLVKYYTCAIQAIHLAKEILVSDPTVSPTDQRLTYTDLDITEYMLLAKLESISEVE